MKILDLPNSLKGKLIKSCLNDCPFWNEGDSGYGSHCNLVELKIAETLIPFTGCKFKGRFLKNCPLEDF